MGSNWSTDTTTETRVNQVLNEYRDFPEMKEWDTEFKEEGIQVEEIKEVPSLILLRNVLTPKETKQIIDLTYKVKWASDDASRTHHIITKLPGSIRTVLSQRLRPFLPKDITIDGTTWYLLNESNNHYERIDENDNRGGYCISEKTRLNRYPENIEFLSHYDDGDMISHDIRSLLSLVIYLNDDFEGGETVFYTPDRTIKIKPENGMVTLFLHYGMQNPLHSSAAQHNSSSLYKFILRTNVLYSLNPGCRGHNEN